MRQPPPVEEFERTLPWNGEAERAVLGAILVHNEAFETAIEKVKGADFFRKAHQSIFDAMVALHDQRQAIDFVTLKNELGRTGDLDEVGGPAYVASLADGVPRATNVEHYCLAVNEQVLMADLQWTPCGDVRSDDPILGFDEYPSMAKRRHWHIGRVLRSEPTRARCLRVILDDGTVVICTPDHKWLVSDGHTSKRWVRADQLLYGRIGRRGPANGDVGRLVIRAVRPWTPSATWRSGWLAGLLDGEGSVTYGNDGGGSLLTFSQKPGLVLERSIAILEEHGFRYSTTPREDSGVVVVNILGGFLEQVRLLGTIRPARLLRDFTRKWHPRFMQRNELSRVVAIENAGEHEIQQIATSTRTYIGAGFAMHNCNIVKEKATLRALIYAANKVLSAAYESELDAATILDHAESEILAIGEQRDKRQFAEMHTVVSRNYARLEQVFDRKGLVSGVATGFTDLDEMTRGLQSANLILIGARPSMGKTSLALNIAQHVAQPHREQHVGFFSLEMSESELFMRMLASEAQIDSHRIQSGALGQKDFTRLSAGMETLRNLHLHIDDTANISLREMRSKARRLKNEHGLHMLVVDYIQLMESAANERYENRTVELGKISRGLKGLSKELDVPVVVLTQLSRGPESRSDHRPQLSDLRESGALEQDADVVILVYRDDMYNRDQNNPNAGMAELNVAKARNGPTGVVKLAFLREQTRFANLAPSGF